MTANVVRLRPAAEDTAADAFATLNRHLERSSLKPHTVRAYRRQAAAYIDWLARHAAAHSDAFTDRVGAEAAVKAWRRSMLEDGRSAATVNQALAAVALMYQQTGGLTLDIDRTRIPKPGAPDALTPSQQGAVQRAADRLVVAPGGPFRIRDAAIIWLLLESGARVEECARLTLNDVPITARTGSVRLLGKGDQVRINTLPPTSRARLSAWMAERVKLIKDGPDPGWLWLGQRGRMGVPGITKVVLAVGEVAKLPGLRPHVLRHTYATRLRQSGADPAMIQAAMGHASIETTQRYFRASAAEVAAAIERAFGE